MTNDELLQKWINGTISAEELQAFKLHPEYDALLELHNNTEDMTVPATDRKKMTPETLETKKNQDGEHNSVSSTAAANGSRRLIPSWAKYSVVALILICVGWFFLADSGNMTTNELAKGEKLEELLPDDSYFVLNAESTLKYNAEGWTENRSINLKGEAFFEVKEGSAFTVQTPNGKVEVHGTKFNVWSRKSTLEVMCFSGKVKVTFVGGKSAAELTKNQAVRFSPNQAPEQWEFQTSEKPGWVRGISDFKNVEVSRVIAEMERQFDINIVSKSINTKEIITCNFPHQDLKMALKTAFSSFNIKYEIQDNQKVILSQ